MNVIVFLDDNNGMLFNNRRQSRDRIAQERILSLVRESTPADGFADKSRFSADGAHPDPVLWMNAYSAGLFPSLPDCARMEERFLSCAKPGDFCLVETQHLLPFRDQLESLYLFRWNRRYPGDFFFDLDVKDGSWQLCRTEEFAGSSHKKITLEHYHSL